MPWKVFTQSLALTNFGDKLANDLFIQRQKCLLLPKYSPKVLCLRCMYGGVDASKVLP